MRAPCSTHRIVFALIAVVHTMKVLTNNFLLPLVTVILLAWNIFFKILFYKHPAHELHLLLSAFGCLWVERIAEAAFSLLQLEKRTTVVILVSPPAFLRKKLFARVYHLNQHQKHTISFSCSTDIQILLEKLTVCPLLKKFCALKNSNLHYHNLQ